MRVMLLTDAFFAMRRENFKCVLIHMEMKTKQKEINFFISWNFLDKIDYNDLFSPYKIVLG